jgi:preprotein translocase subunit SecD
MKTRTRSIILLVVVYVLIILLGFFVLKGFDVGIYEVRPLLGIQQGLDITGGVYTVYQASDASIENFDAKMDGAMIVLRTRLDAKGFTEATIARQGSDKIRVEIPVNNSSEITDPTEISQYIGSPAKLKFQDPEGNTVMEGADIERAYRSVDPQTNEPVVAFQLSPSGTRKFAEATTRLKGQHISIVLDGEVVSNPRVNDAILNGSGIISGSFTEQSAQDLSMQIESGALPLDLKEIEVRSISATLGVDALKNSIFAGLVGLIVLFAFLLIIYRLPGLVACTGLVVYTFGVLLLLTSVPGVQLTLPGIAGILLGIGMAVDANVIIFERFKEEFRAGKTLRTSFKSGTKKAFVTIMDSNITTLICAVVLAIFCTGAIKGFAYTLIISILVSMFSALVVSNGVMKLFINLNIKNPNLFIWNVADRRQSRRTENER